MLSRRDAVIAERFKIVQIAEEESVSEAARRGECSRTTVYKLVARYRRGGLAALANRPRGPRLPVPEEVAELVVALKTGAQHRSSTKVQQLLEERYDIRLSRQSIWRVLSARGLARIVDPEPIVRFARPLPNQLWQIDLKEEVRFPFGKAHLLLAVDDASRYCVGGVWMTDKREATVLGALAQLLERQGLPEAILTDRAPCFYGAPTRHRGLSTYQLALEMLGVTASFAKPYKPRTKGKIEKLIQFVERDFIWEVRDQVGSLPQLQARWEEWCEWYDRRRPHSSLGERPPAHYYQASRHPAPLELRRLLAVEEIRTVRRDATIAVGGRSFSVPPELIRKHVAVRLLGPDIIIEHAGRTVAAYTR